MSRKELLLFSVGVFLTVLAWLVADIRHAATEEKIKVRTAIPTLKKYEIKRPLLDVLKDKNQ
jgi:hypothetical protein